MYKVPEDWKLSDFLELSNDEKLKWLYNGVKNAAGGSDLPDVTSDDNGDVLTVVNGEWNKATPSGGSSELFKITLTWNADWSSATLNKTFSEIKTALESGLFPLVTSVSQADDTYEFDIYGLEQFYIDTNGCTADITIVDNGTGQLNVYTFGGATPNSYPAYP